MRGPMEDEMKWNASIKKNRKKIQMGFQSSLCMAGMSRLML